MLKAHQRLGLVRGLRPVGERRRHSRDVDRHLSDRARVEVGNPAQSEAGVYDGMEDDPTADQSVSARPGLKVLFTTGYSRNAIVHHGRLDAGVRLLQKPFTFDQLASRVREVLDEIQVRNANPQSDSKKSERR